jgi:uncharacterized protein (DUF4415 family)
VSSTLTERNVDALSACAKPIQEKDEDMNENADIDRLPFAEYAALMAEIGAKEYGNPDTPKLSFEELASSDMTFSEIEAEYGEETAINAGIARDPDTRELTSEDLARMRPAIEVVPDLVVASLRRKCKENPSGKSYTTVEIDNDLLQHFLDEAGPDWHKRLNDTLREAVFGADDL